MACRSVCSVGAAAVGCNGVVYGELAYVDVVSTEHANRQPLRLKWLAVTAKREERQGVISSGSVSHRT